MINHFSPGHVARRGIALLLLLAVVSIGCRTMYYNTMEMFGREKRDLLKSNVEAAKEDQAEAGEQFQDALTQLKGLYGFEGGKLEGAYNRFKSEYEGCESRASAVRSRVHKVETIANDLFREWEQEMNSISTPGLRADSQRKLTTTKTRFGELLGSMKKAEQSMDPVLTLFRDHVLYLKHNLNAQAIGSLRGEAAEVEREIDNLIANMNASIAQADTFIQTLK
ncbi:DUF2959 domain-containing protein [bacterium]|nr:DUF2959 domain-containing protein [bacterium]